MLLNVLFSFYGLFVFCSTENLDIRLQYESIYHLEFDNLGAIAQINTYLGFNHLKIH